jgi:putative phage-type endonuclease
MARGTVLEPDARKRYEIIRKVRVEPACLQSTKYAWQRASVDGLALNGSAVVEIKCGERVYKKTATTMQVPHYYVGQLQHILAVAYLPCIDFFCYLPPHPEVHLRIKRNNAYIDRLISAEQSFWQQLVKQRR